MHTEELVTKITHTLRRDNGSEVRIVAEAFFGAGLHQSIDVFVLRRDTPDHPWELCSDRPHPDWREMSVEEYVERGRSEMLQTVSHGEILKATSAIGQPMSAFN